MGGRDYAKALGERLRRIRLQKGLSLQAVQQSSAGNWKAAVIGAYERGDRNVTVARLSELADFYGVPVSEILPEDAEAAVGIDSRRRVVLDLTELERVPEQDRAPLSRFATAIQVQRGDFNGRVLTIRKDDLRAIAALLQTDPPRAVTQLEEWGALVESPTSLG